ncbi:MAG: hypothetical protein IJD79_08635 [Clostridia bacterium]|nr:hypothetical protein [Clostridia bacterium]
MIGFKKEIEVDVHDVDFNGVCRASSLMKYIQSAAQTQLTENGMSYENLKEMGKAFIISRIRLEFYSSVHTYDRLVAHTFPCISRGYSFIRCYALYRDDEIIGRAISIWALIDTTSRSLVKVADFELNLPTYEPWDNIAISPIRLPSAMKKVGTYTVTYADLDQNKHINNTKYADIFSNFLPLDKKRIDSMSINYMNEAKYKDTLDVYVEESNGYYYIRTVLPDGRVNSEAEIHLCGI